MLVEPIVDVQPSNPDPSLINEDFAPVSSKDRSFSTWDLAALWIGLVVCVPSYTLVGRCAPHRAVLRGLALKLYAIPFCLVLWFAPPQPYRPGNVLVAGARAASQRYLKGLFECAVLPQPVACFLA
jgi:hypothetical protein